MGRCEPENTPEMQKCPKTFVHDCRMTGMTGETRDFLQSNAKSED